LWWILVSASLLAAQAVPPAPSRWVTDTANFISPAAANALDARLQAYQQATGHQLLVYIGNSTGGVPIEDFAVRTFEAWRVGRQGIDDGLVLFIMSDDRRLRIEVGYGLEGQVPDAIASRVINEVIVPRIQAGDSDGAVTAGIDAVVSVISGQGLGAFGGGGGEPPGGIARPLTIGQLVVYGIIGIIFLMILATNPSLAIYLLGSILASGGRRGGGRGGWGGGSFGGGGFRGGGGRSGGGGASGSW
jgi:uncharacterized protein